MLKEVFGFILAYLGEQSGFPLNVHGVVTVALFICCGILAHMVLWQRYIADKDWSSNPMPTKVCIITQGFFGLICACYIIYLLIAWNTWTINTLILVGAITLFGSVLAIGLLWIAVGFIYIFIYSWIKNLILLLKK